jgi:hypothetical protein
MTAWVVRRWNALEHWPTHGPCVTDVDETFRTNSRSSVWKTVRWESRNPSVEDIHLAHPARLANLRAAKREQYLGQMAIHVFWPRGPPMLIYLFMRNVTFMVGKHIDM